MISCSVDDARVPYWASLKWAARARRLQQLVAQSQHIFKEASWKPNSGALSTRVGTPAEHDAQHGRKLTSTSKAVQSNQGAGSALSSSTPPVVVVRVQEEGGHYSVGEEREQLVAEEVAFLLATVGRRSQER
jgi:hypothetical protein